MDTLNPRRIEGHQLEGLDDRSRVFNRTADLNRTENQYTASFAYEGQFHSSDSRPTIKEAIHFLVRRLHKLGFSKLRSRLNFRGKRYLAEREPWIEYSDPSPSA